MCVTFLMVNPVANENDLQLVIINNRDEYYDRPAVAAEFWHSDIICGRDMTEGRQGGTWLGMTRSGKIGVLHNILQPSIELNHNAKGRGHLVIDYLKSNESGQEFCSKVAQDATNMNGFALLCLNKQILNHSWSISYFSNKTKPVPIVENIEPGIYAFGNSHRSNPWHKVQYGLRSFQNCLVRHSFQSDKKPLIEDLFGVLIWPDSLISNQGIDFGVNANHLSSCFVQFPRSERRYGTRTQTVIVIGSNNHVIYEERTATHFPIDDSEPLKWESKQHEFELFI